MNLIFLVGMPGAGKTYWGQRMAATLNLPFIDLDQYIVQRQGKDMDRLFEDYAEDGFRTMEQLCLSEIVHQTKETTIIATGGGTPMFHSNMQLMRQRGKIIYLNARLDTLMANLALDADIRPLLRTADLRLKLETLLKQRSPVYEKADFILNTESLSIATFAQILAKCTDRPL